MSLCSNPECGRIQGTEPMLKGPRHAVQMRREQLISLSAQGMRVQELSPTLHLHEEYVRQLLAAIQRGRAGVAAHPSPPGASTDADPEDEPVVVEIAKMPPRAFSEPFNHWSLRKLTDCLGGRRRTRS